MQLRIGQNVLRSSTKLLRLVLISGVYIRDIPFLYLNVSEHAYSRHIRGVLYPQIDYHCEYHKNKTLAKNDCLQYTECKLNNSRLCTFGEWELVLEDAYFPRRFLLYDVHIVRQLLYFPTPGFTEHLPLASESWCLRMRNSRDDSCFMMSISLDSSSIFRPLYRTRTFGQWELVLEDA